jgi:uncharacterized membrane protein YhaH (DUF805 family)
MKWYLKVLKNYITFSGRARRSELWYFLLFNMIFSILTIAIDNVLDTTIKMGYGVSLPYGYLYIMYVLAVFIPSLAVSVRRLHDVGKSGWMYFIILIPIIGAIWLLVLFLTDSQTGKNKWGENLKEIDILSTSQPLEPQGSISIPIEINPVKEVKAYPSPVNNIEEPVPSTKNKSGSFFSKIILVFTGIIIISSLVYYFNYKSSAEINYANEQAINSENQRLQAVISQINELALQNNYNEALLQINNINWIYKPSSYKDYVQQYNLQRENLKQTILELKAERVVSVQNDDLQPQTEEDNWKSYVINFQNALSKKDEKTLISLVAPNLPGFGTSAEWVSSVLSNNIQLTLIKENIIKVDKDIYNGHDKKLCYEYTCLYFDYKNDKWLLVDSFSD